MKKLTGIGPPNVSDEFSQRVEKLFNKVLEIGERTRDKDRMNRSYYPSTSIRSSTRSLRVGLRDAQDSVLHFTCRATTPLSTATNTGSASVAISRHQVLRHRQG